MEVSVERQPDVSVSKRKWKKRLKQFWKNKPAFIGGCIVLFFIIISIIAPLIAPHDPYEVDLVNKLNSPSMEHWLGTDDKGRDVLSRLLYGARLSLGVGFASLIIGAFFGVLLGIFSGYYGRWVDTVIMRLVDVLLAFPGILLALAIVAALGPGLVNVTIAVSIYAIPLFARIARGSTLTVKNLEYIDGIRSLGASEATIILKHILPNITSPLIVQATLSLATVILTTAALSFLGLGAQPPSPEWGYMLSDGRNFLYTAPYLTIFPGLTIATLVLGFNLFGDGLRDILDTKN